MKGVPEEVSRIHCDICKKCQIRKDYARAFDMHFDWIDCPYNCENDYEHYQKLMEEEHAKAKKVAGANLRPA